MPPSFPNWLARFGPLLEMAEVEGDQLRYKPNQAMLLYALLSAQPSVDVDRKFQAYRQRIQKFSGVKPRRPAASHPGLINGRKLHESSAKLETLIEQVQEITAEGHKALIFSQFTSFLDIVRIQLDKLGMNYEYLDGQTHDRQRRVDRFQTDAACSLFLISLKAGGFGLNLTAADYVFILDPWWNPAVESQAVDRAHRIGQTRRVIAYRLICRDTVEEKIVQLQESRRELAESIINQDNSLIRNLSAEDLQLLLS